MTFLSPQMENLRDLITELAVEEAERGKPFILASGKLSNYKVILARLLYAPHGAKAMVECLAPWLEETLPGNIDDLTYFGGLQNGAILLAGYLLAGGEEALLRRINAFSVRKQPKGRGMNNLIEGLMPDESLSGRSVVILEDVTTTGGSAWQAAEAVLAQGGRIIAVRTIVDREEGATAFFRKKGVDFKAMFTAKDILSEGLDPWSRDPTPEEKAKFGIE